MFLSNLDLLKRTLFRCIPAQQRTCESSFTSRRHWAKNANYLLQQVPLHNLSCKVKVLLQTSSNLRKVLLKVQSKTTLPFFQIKKMWPCKIQPTSSLRFSKAWLVGTMRVRAGWSTISVMLVASIRSRNLEFVRFAVWHDWSCTWSSWGCQRSWWSGFPLGAGAACPLWRWLIHTPWKDFRTTLCSFVIWLEIYRR